MKNLVSRLTSQNEESNTSRQVPTEGFATVSTVISSQVDTADAAEAAGRKLKSAHPYLQVYDAARRCAAC